jgi:apolipoprotein N-acyltransferase
MAFIIKNAINFYTARNRWYLPFAAGVCSTLGMPPLSGQLHPVFTLFPFLSFVICVPLFYCSLVSPLRRAVLHAYCFGIGASLCQLYWIAFVVPEGLYHLVFLGVVLLTMFEALFFIVNGLAFRFALRMFPQWYVALFPAWWVCIEFVKSIGEISFPWNFIGYSLTPLLPLSQISSVTGTYGMSFIVVLGNCLLFDLLNGWESGQKTRKKKLILAGFAIFLAASSIGGWLRLHGSKATGPTARLSLVQPVIDQNQWGNTSLDTSFAVIESLVYQAALDKPEAIILPESALLCYLARRPQLRNRVIGWSRQIKVPLLLGSLHWDAAPPKSARDYLVYNTAFFLDTGATVFQPYYKMKLVPFSEILPFQGIFPILSRVNLGQADFRPGTKPVTYEINNKIKGAPFICFDIIYPSFVRNRISKTTNLLIQITNDGWFGRSSGPFQHALYAQQRCIENGISLARCANTGISMVVDQYGRILKRTRLGERRILTGSVPLSRIPTLYSHIGDWPVALSGCIVVICVLIAVFRGFRKRGRSLLINN